MSVQFKKRNQANKNLRPKETPANEEEDDTHVQKCDTKVLKGIAFSTSSSRNFESSNLTTTVYESSREVVPIAYAGDAFHTTEIDTASDRDARTILERNIKLNMEGVPDSEPNVYRGQAGYKNFVNKDMSQVGANKFTGTQGPIRAPSFLRSSCRFDYQPDICKDYKETGFCGYGDNCKFLHDRGDYKSGWQLEREWDSNMAKKKKKLEESIASFVEGDEGQDAANEEDEDNYAIDEEEELPFACHICREEFKNPVVTLCAHYFCSQCIIDSTRKSTKCPICDKQTSGVFNRANKLIKKLEKLGKSGSSSSGVQTGLVTVQRKRPVGAFEVVADTVVAAMHIGTNGSSAVEAEPTQSADSFTTTA